MKGKLNCKPLPLPQNALVVNQDDCGSYKTLTDAITALTMDGQVIIVESHTKEVGSLAVPIHYDVDIVGVHGRQVSMVNDIVFEIVNGKTVRLHQMTMKSDGVNDIFLVSDGDLYILDGSYLGIEDSTAGSYQVRINNNSSSLYIYNSTLYHAGNSNINLNNALGFYFKNSLFSAYDRNIHGRELTPLSLNIRDCDFHVDAVNGRNNLLFAQRPLVNSKIIRNTFEGATSSPSIRASIWNDAIASNNTFINHGGGALDSFITLKSGCSNDIV